MLKSKFMSFIRHFIAVLASTGLASSVAAAERVNHAGRILGTAPHVTSPVLFNTPEADVILSALQILPPDNAWNEDISRRPVLANSAAIMAKIASELRSDRRALRAFYEMNFVLVPDGQPLVRIDFFNYSDESDPGPYPIPANLPIEGWPKNTGGLSLKDWQRDINDEGGDRHAIIVQPGTGSVWETWLTKMIGANWEASNGAKFNLNSNALRPLTWTSGDAAGLSMFAGLVRYDECERGTVEHALRIVVKHTRREFIYPATHYASVPSTTDPAVPAMGQRLRLRSSFVIPENWTRHEKAVLHALKKYGALVADNGNFFSISVAPDQRFPDDAFDHFKSVSVGDFEIIQTTGPNEGPRSPSAPVANAGPAQTIAPGATATLQGSAAFAAPAQVRWKLYSGPGTVTFADASRTNTTATLTAPGKYTLMLSVDDGIHAVAYDSLVVHVMPGLVLNIVRIGNDVTLRWMGGNPPFRLEAVETLGGESWQPILMTDDNVVTLGATSGARFYRVISTP